MAIFFFGDNSTPTSGNYGFVGDDKYASPYTAATGGFATELVFYASNSGTKKWKGIIYDNYNDGSYDRPNNLVAVTQEEASHSVGWNTATFSPGVNLDAGIYHIGIIIEQPGWDSPVYAAGDPYSYHSNDNLYISDPSDPWGTLSGQNFKLAFYVNKDTALNAVVEDTVLVTESIGALVYPMSDINITTIVDSVIITESISAEFTDLFITNVYEEIVISESINLSTVTFFGTDPRPDYYPKLPTVKCAAAFRESFIIEGEAPTVSAVGYFGSTAMGKVPTASATGTIQGLFSGYISIHSKVPTSNVEGFFGSTAEGKVPTVKCAAVLFSGDITVTGYAPVVSAEVVIPNYFISVTGYSPFPSVQAELAGDGYLTIEGTVPAAYGSVAVSEAVTIIITGVVSTTKAEYNNIQVGSSFIDITGTAPVVTMYHPTGEEDPGGISIVEEERFEDITLQYSRWPDAI